MIQKLLNLFRRKKPAQAPEPAIVRPTQSKPASVKVRVPPAMNYPVQPARGASRSSAPTRSTSRSEQEYQTPDLSFYSSSEPSRSYSCSGSSSSSSDSSSSCSSGD